MQENENIESEIETETEDIIEKQLIMFLNIKKTHAEMFNRILTGLRQTPNSGGRERLLRYVNGEILSRSAAIVAKCCECSGFYVDGLRDCGVYSCPLYPYMPYGQLKKRYQRPESREKETV